MVVRMDLRDRIDRFGNMRGQNLGLEFNRGLGTHRHLPRCMKPNGVKKRPTRMEVAETRIRWGERQASI
jgi:hypothetical protein